MFPQAVAVYFVTVVSAALAVFFGINVDFTTLPEITML